jgi:HemY protein
MRILFWLLTLAALAIGLTLLGRVSDGYVLWVMPPWRVELSLNLFVVVQLIVLVLTYLMLRALFISLNLPSVVAAYRERRARQFDEHAAVTALRHFWEGRYVQSLKFCEKVSVTEGNPRGTDGTAPAQGIAALVGLKSAQALRDPRRIDEWRARAEALDGAWRTARLMAEIRIELDARDFAAAATALAQLGAKERRQISAQRLALRLAQGQGDWPELLRLTRQLEKHGALTSDQARPLRLRAQRGIIDSLQEDPAQLMKLWQGMIAADREDAQIVQRIVRALTATGAGTESAQIIEDYFDEHWEPSLLTDYADCAGGDVLRRIAHAERWLHEHPRDADLLLALGRLCQKQQLWGKAQSYLEASLAITPASVNPTGVAHIELARLLDQLGRTEDANRHYRAAANCAEQTVQSQSRGGRKSV